MFAKSTLLILSLAISCPSLSAQTLLPNGIVLPAGFATPRPPSQLPATPTYLTAPPTVIPIGQGRELFVDDFLIQSTTLTRQYHRPVPYTGNPIFQTGGIDAVSSIPFSDGIWYDPADRLYKAFYWGYNGNSLSYATSLDGKVWIKPTLANAAIPDTNVVILFSGRDSGTVWMDLNDADPNRKFKAFIYTGRNRQSIYFSPDGIQWTQQPMFVPSVSDRTTLFWNPFRSLWVESTRGAEPLPAGITRGGYTSRLRYYSETRNFTDWTPDPGTSFWTGPDENDPPYPGPYGEHYPELYNLDAVAYESLFVGLFSWFYENPGPALVELGVGFSRDGFQWHRPTRGAADKAFIRASNVPGSWNGFNTQSVGGGFLVVGDELWFYYSGRNARHGIQPTSMSTGLAILRRDGFASMDAGPNEGTLTTRPIRFNGSHLFVNVKNPSGQLRAEVLDSQGSVIGKFTRANSIPVSADRTIQKLSWGGADLGTLSGQVVRLRFYLMNGSLYSFWISPSPSGPSQGYIAAGGPSFLAAVDTIGAGAAIVANDTTPPIRSVAPASGTAQYPADQTGLQIVTNEAAKCAFSTNSNTPFEQMTRFASTGALAHSNVLSFSGTYYVRCQDLAGNLNQDDFRVETTDLPGDRKDSLQISGLGISQITTTGATVVWATNKPASKQVFYGATPVYGSASPLTPAMGSAHTVTLSGLTPKTNYHVKAVSTAGTETVEMAATFKTMENSLTITGFQITSVTRTSAVVTWSTNRNANARVLYGTTPSYGSATTITPVYGTTHSIELTGLNAGTTYHVSAVSTDHDGNSISADGLTFTTLSAPVSISNARISGSTPTTLTVSWSTSVPTTDLISYGTTLSYRTGRIPTTTPTTSHNVVITDLAPDTLYYVRIESTDQHGHVAAVEGLSAKTPQTALEIREFGPFAITSTEASVSWAFFRPAGIQLLYGTSTQYGMTINLPTLRVSSSTQLTGLIPGTTYYLKLIATDGGGIKAEATSSFNTTGGAPPLQITALQSSAISQTSAAVNWVTNAPANRQLRYGKTAQLASVTTVDARMSSAHTVLLSGLSAGTTYYYQAVSADAANRKASSAVASFTTTASSSPLPLTLTNVKVGSINTNSAMITWNTSLPANDRVQFGTTPALGLSTPTSAALGTSHSVALLGLNPGMTYYYAATSIDSLGRSATSGVLSFTTTSNAPGGGPYALQASPFALTAGDTVTVNWQAPAGRPARDWIGLFQVGADNRAYRWFHFTDGQRSGTVTFRFRPTYGAGPFEFRYLLNDWYEDTATSNPINVVVQ